MKSIIIQLFISCFLFVNVYSQPPGIKGKVINEETGEALTGAHAILKSLESGEEIARLTNENGEFVFHRVPEGMYSLKVSFVGFGEYIKNIAILNPFQNLGEIKMKPKAEAFEELTLIKNTPLAQVKEDTLEYNADAYKTTPDASAEDLVAKMPGVEVGQGTIKAQGEEIRKLQVDGKPFFNSNPSLALKNLPAEIIEKIQVYDEQSEQSQFTGFDDGNTLKTMNVVTRKNMRNGQFGSFSAGYGKNNAYAVSGNINSFSGERRISLLGQSNNVNQQGFGMQDIMGVMGSGSRGGMRGGQGEMAGGGPDMRNFMTGSQSGISDIHAFGLNYNESRGKKLNLSGNYFFNRVNNLNIQSINQQYLLSGFEGQEYSENSRSERNNDNHRMFLRLDYRINENSRIMFRPDLSFQNNNSGSDIFGETTIVNDLLNRTINSYTSNLKGLNYSSDLLLMHAFQKKGRTISLNLGQSANKRDGLNYLLAVNDYFQSGSGYTDSLDQKADNDSRGNSISGRLMYTEALGDNAQLQINYNYSWNWNKADQGSYSFDPLSLSYDILDTLLSSKFDNRYHRQELGAGYRYRKDKLNLMAGLNYQTTRLENDEELPVAVMEDYRFHAVLPAVMVNREMGSNRNIRLMLRTGSNVPSVNQLQSVVDNSNPLRLVTGNPSLEPDISHNYILRYSTANTEKARMFFAGIRFGAASNHIANSRFMATSDTIISGIELAKGSQLIRPVNLDGYWRASVFSTFGIPAGFIKSNLNLTSSFSLGRNPGLINGLEGYSLDRTFSVGFALVSNMGRNVDFTLSSNSNFNSPLSTFNDNLGNQYFFQLSVARLKVILESGWFFNSDFSHSIYMGLSEGYNQGFAYWNLKAGRKLFKNQRGEISLGFFDLLNQNASISRTITDSYIQDLKSNVLERYFLLSFRYDLRNMSLSPPSFPGAERPERPF